MNKLELEAVSLVHEFYAHSLTVATAESCTGGLLASAITSVAGASDVFCGSIVAYSPQAKQDLLSVDARLVEGGAIYSSACAQAMAQGALQAFPLARWTLATTGVCGPGSDRGVAAGTVYVAAASKEVVHTKELHLSGKRGLVRFEATVAALSFLRELIA